MIALVTLLKSHKMWHESLIFSTGSAHDGAGADQDSCNKSQNTARTREGVTLCRNGNIQAPEGVCACINV